MTERADRLVLDYLSRVGDHAHGVLRQDQRLELVARVRARIEEARGGSGDPRRVARVLAGLGEPAELVRAERKRLAAQNGARADVADEPPVADGTLMVSIPGYPGDAEASTAVFPRVVDDEEPRRAMIRPSGVPEGVRRHTQVARSAVARRGTARRRSGGLGLPGAWLRRAAMASANPMATEGRDARTILKEHPREGIAVLLLVAAAVLLPFRLDPIAIFPVPLIVWAVAAVVTWMSTGWEPRDRLTGAGAPVAGYVVGGLLVTAVRWVQGVTDAGALADEYFRVGEIMFMLGSAAGVFYLSYRLLNPPERHARRPSLPH
ncbi:hypothetical protein [Spongiactinospora sp. TRM90649]|uniref:hypothetical protein n=1 Tax=Spongiactinospora sp. TRM90649 TaxID=3031114 RepID=UPI0023F925FB|nr:hypothetical protein [Spongiactinospora sp. TRM90649]MDF5757818.1 hypothetical protein [Spongiactinospora sp. TRM90649]